MAPALCRVEKTPRTRAKLPYERTPKGTLDVPRSAVIKDFRRRKGIDLGSTPTACAFCEAIHEPNDANDAQLAALMLWVRCGMKENEQKVKERREARPGPPPDYVTYVRTETQRGGTPSPRNLTTALQALVHYVGGPSDAARALLHFRLHRHHGFIVGVPRGEPVRDLLRRLEKRLVQPDIRRS